ncbi:hypothetical protein GGR58DRAFT_502421 [Xylaria digitata]|nr:hypothetical protein GGR58DRAFT_502421 [Xylaria digitata]
MTEIQISESSYIFFGPIVASWTTEGLQELQTELQRNTSLRFLQRALTDLPSLLPYLQTKENVPSLSRLQHLQELADFASGKSIPDITALSNVHLAPLTVIYQALEFIRAAGLLQCVPNSLGYLQNTTAHSVPIGKGSFIPRAISTRKNAGLSPHTAINQAPEIDNR